MIMVNELRIGNWVLYLNELYIVDGIKYEENAPSEKYRIAFKTIDGKLSNAKMVNWIEPIPLTPEILEKAGFEKEITTGKSWANDGDEIIGYKNKRGNMRIQDNLVFYSISTRLELIKNDLKHLHQLQNLFYCLTGTELEINL